MIDQLLSANKITRFHYLVFAVFECNEHGKEFLNKMLHDTYMEEPSTLDSGSVTLAMIDGRRSLFRDILKALEFTKSQLKENNYDGSANPTS